MTEIYTDPDPQRVRENTMWVASLSNGTTVYQRDDEEEYPGNSWLRLKDYVAKNNLNIIGFSVRFRDHHEHLPSDKDGYFFIRSLLASPFSSTVKHFYKVGYLEGGKIHIIKYSAPELIAFERETVDENDETVVESLIRNNHIEKWVEDV